MRSVVVFLTMLMAAPTMALDETRSPQAQLPGHDDLDCYCLAQGRMFAPGDQVCLKTAEGPRLAQCRMEINVMSWSITETPCPET